MMLSHRYASLRFQRLSPLVKEAFSIYSENLNSLGKKIHCLNYEELEKRGFLKERHWRSGVFMAAATSLPLLYRSLSFHDILTAICAKASISVSAKLLDNLNDEVHTYTEALHSLSDYRCALGKGAYAAQNGSDTSKAGQSACEIATWVYKTVDRCGSTDIFSEDVDLLVSGQIASLNHKKEKYHSMKEYLSEICERSIGNVWIDVDLAFLKDERTLIKEGNGYTFKSFLVYDDVQDIYRDLNNNSINAAVLLGLERGLLSESEIERKNTEEIIGKLEKSGIFRDLLQLGDLIFVKGLDTISECSDNLIDKEGFKASLGLIRMFNIRKILRKKKNLGILGTFLANQKRLERIKEVAPEYVQEMVEYVE